MKVNTDTGLIEGIEFLDSPNCDNRPDDTRPEVIIVHAISLPPGEFGGPYVDQLFLNTLDPDQHHYFREISDLQVSAHLFIRRTGEVRQFVALDKRAWHAGVSECEGKQCVNDFSIGIELEGCDEQGFEDPQYQSLVAVTNALLRGYPGITADRIYGHSDISPGRKTDPGPGFDWHRFRRLLSE